VYPIVLPRRESTSRIRSDMWKQRSLWIESRESCFEPRTREIVLHGKILSWTRCVLKWHARAVITGVPYRVDWGVIITGSNAVTVQQKVRNLDENVSYFRWWGWRVSFACSLSILKYIIYLKKSSSIERSNPRNRAAFRPWRRVIHIEHQQVVLMGAYCVFALSGSPPVVLALADDR
jgi:hypothetical protein